MAKYWPGQGLEVTYIYGAGYAYNGGIGLKSDKGMEDEKDSKTSFMQGKERSMLFMVIFAVGILILLTGVLLGNINGAIHRPEYNSDDYDGYETTTRWLNFFSTLIINIGMVIIACGSIITAMFNPRMPPTLRAGLVVAGGLILGLRFG